MAISIPSVVGDYIDAVIADLQQGSSLGLNAHAAAQNYLRAQDAATILELLSGLVATGELTAAANGTTTTVVEDAGTFVPGMWVGATLTFESDTTTAALQGLSRTVIANDDATLTLGEALPSASATGDTFTVTANPVSSELSAIRQGQSGYDAPRGNVYGNHRTVVAAYQKFVEQLSLVAATGTLTFTDVGNEDETFTIGSVTYTLKAAPAGIAYAIDIGATAEETSTNFVAAINASGTPDTEYGAGTLAHPQVRATAGGVGVVNLFATVPGAQGNLATTTDSIEAAFGAATLTGGAVDALRTRSSYTLPTGAYSIPTVHPAGQPGDNAWFAQVIDQARDLVAAFTLPT